MSDSSENAQPGSSLSRELVVQNKMDAEVLVQKDDEEVNGKSIMGLMMLAAGKGSKVRFNVTGGDAEPMLNELQELFERKFDEA